MEGLFPEYENENSLRGYPFASGCSLVSEDGREIPADVFVDACLYPINPSGTLYMSGVSAEGVISVSDDSGVVMTGSVGSSREVEMYVVSGIRRHVGTLVAKSADGLSAFAFQGVDMAFSREASAFASSCVFPVVVDGVVSLDVGGIGQKAMVVGFSNDDDDEVRVSKGAVNGHDTIRFDVIPRFATPDMDSIRQIRCVVDGNTPFRIQKMSDNTVMLYLDGIDKESVCAGAHRENAYEMADTCGCEKHAGNSREIPYIRQEVVIDIPYRADSAFYLVTPNMPGYGNPISITLKDGVSIPKTTGLKVVEDNTNNGYIVPESELLDDSTSKGVVIQVPGLSGGEI